MVGGFGPRFSYKWTQQMPKFFSKVNVSGVYQKLAACLWLPPESVRIAEIVEAKGQDWIFAKTTAPLSSQYAPGINIDFGSSIIPELSILYDNLPTVPVVPDSSRIEFSDGVILSPGTGIFLYLSNPGSVISGTIRWSERLR